MENRDQQLEAQFRKFVEADALRLNEEPRNVEGEFYEEFVKNKLTYDARSRRFTARLPFKEGLQPSMNRALCLARLRSLDTRLKKSKRRDEYDEEFRSMLNLGFIERVDHPEQPQSKGVSYLPHREVIRTESLTTKLRIVFDASAKEKQKYSLNETLESGPNLNADLLAIILNFRRHKVTLMADIEKAFPQVIIHEEDRDFLRLLWDEEGS
ncbi:PREDICTED: uncharacterized protein LOC108357113, partial [Rhagoletis zephyria]|uniref:uncharacterized protein LOC108357113 n=1 Tax=Rhagoletis zephyria TaxID=28612 RepID=UPI0008118A18